MVPQKRKSPEIQTYASLSPLLNNTVLNILPDTKWYSVSTIVLRNRPKMKIWDEFSELTEPEFIDNFFATLVFAQLAHVQCG